MNKCVYCKRDEEVNHIKLSHELDPNLHEFIICKHHMKLVNITLKFAEDQIFKNKDKK
jgi:glutaredoxin